MYGGRYRVISAVEIEGVRYGPGDLVWLSSAMARQHDVAAHVEDAPRGESHQPVIVDAPSVDAALGAEE